MKLIKESPSLSSPPPCLFAWSLAFPHFSSFSTFASFASLLNLFALRFLVLLMLLSDNIDYSLSLLLPSSALVRPILVEQGIEVFLISCSSFFLDLLLQLIDCLKVLSLFLVLFSHFVRLYSFLELLVLLSLLSLFEVVDFLLLLEESTLHFCHVRIAFIHFSKEIIGSANGNLSLDQYFHASLHIFSGEIVTMELD